METKLQSGLPEFNPFSVLFLILLTISFLGVFDIYWDRKKNLFHLPGPLPLPLLGATKIKTKSDLWLFRTKYLLQGNALMFTKPHEFFMGTLQQLRAQYGGTLRIHLGTRANVAVTTPEGFEKILSSNRQITKGKDYKEAVKYLIVVAILQTIVSDLSCVSVPDAVAGDRSPHLYRGQVALQVPYNS